ncbi:MAG: hypothetical protein WDO18_05620 [Acidobacteriota bacterium]
MQLAIENQRFQIHADVQRLGRQKRLFADGRVFADSQIAGRDSALHQCEFQIPDADRAAQRVAQLLFKQRPEAVGVDQKRQCEQRRQQDGQSAATILKMRFMGG